MKQFKKTQGHSIYNGKKLPDRLFRIYYKDNNKEHSFDITIINLLHAGLSQFIYTYLDSRILDKNQNGVSWSQSRINHLKKSLEKFKEPKNVARYFYSLEEVHVEQRQYRDLIKMIKHLMSINLDLSNDEIIEQIIHFMYTDSPTVTNLSKIELQSLLENNFKLDNYLLELREARNYYKSVVEQYMPKIDIDSLEVILEESKITVEKSKIIKDYSELIKLKERLRLLGLSTYFYGFLSIANIENYPFVLLLEDRKLLESNVKIIRQQIKDIKVSSSLVGFKNSDDLLQAKILCSGTSSHYDIKDYLDNLFN